LRGALAPKVQLIIRLLGVTVAERNGCVRPGARANFGAWNGARKLPWHTSAKASQNTSAAGGQLSNLECCFTTSQAVLWGSGSAGGSEVALLTAIRWFMQLFRQAFARFLHITQPPTRQTTPSLPITCFNFATGPC
jgi:hypothetical protein